MISKSSNSTQDSLALHALRHNLRLQALAVVAGSVSQNTLCNSYGESDVHRQLQPQIRTVPKHLRNKIYNLV